MAINVSNLTVFDDELSFGLAKKAILDGAQDIKYLNVFNNVNGTLQLNTVATTMYVTNDECATRTDTGSTVFNGNTLTTCPLVIYNELCNKKMQRYYMGKMGANADGIDNPLEGILLDEKLGQASLEIGKIRWQGSTDNGYATVTGNLTACDGFLEIAYSNSASTINVTKTTFTTSNAIATIDSYYSNATSAMKARKDLTLFLSISDFDIYLQALRNANNFNFDSKTEVTEMKHPGARNLMVAGLDALDGNAIGSGAGILTYQENLALGVLEDPTSMKADMWYSKEDDKIKFEVYALQGVNFIHYEHVVKIA